MDLKISIIVPVYNVEDYLKRCVDSILNQSYKNLEIILVNDGSLDNSGLMCDEFKKKDARIKVVHQKNGGLSAARNTGLKNTTGDFVSFIDSDDWIELDMYKEMVHYATKHKLDIVECDIQYTSNEKIKTEPKFLIENQEEAALRIIDNRFFSVCRRIYKFQLIKDMNFIKNYIYEDMLFTSELLCKIQKIGYINKPFYNYFIENTSSIMHGPFNVKNVKSIDVIYTFEKNIKNCFKSEPIIKASKNYILLFSINHYIKLFQFKELDKDFIYRKKLKSLIKSKYVSSENKSTITRIARHSPMWFFNLFLRLSPQKF